jgi:hypothetical protein
MKLQLSNINMGYYDFDHFWSPLEVCAQPPKKKNPEKKVSAPKLVKTIFNLLSRSDKTVIKKADTIIN